MSRQDLMRVNTQVIEEVAYSIRQYAPDAIVVVVTNPLDVMTAVMQRVTGFDCKRVLGMAGILDSGRFSDLLAKELGVSAVDIKALVLGGHGDLMVPLESATSVQGIPLEKLKKRGLVSEERMKNLLERARNGGGEIISLLKTGSAFYGPAACCYADG